MSTTPSITFGGLASGLDTNALIDGLLKAESVPLARMQSRQSLLTSAKGTLSSLLNTLTSVKTAAQGLDSESEFASYRVTSSDESLGVATATGSALAGSYSVVVDSVAREARTRSAVQPDATSELGQAGDFSITVNGVAKTIQVETGDSLTDLATKINGSGASVSASVISTATGAHLVVVGKSTGASNGVTFGETGTVALGMTTYQAATNAKITIDGEFSVERSTNQFTDVIPGLSITAKKASADPFVVTVAPDSTAQASKIQAFIGAYNNAVSAGHLASGWGSIKASNSTLAGDSAVRTALNLLGTTVANTVPGLSGKYNQLAAVGVSLNSDGSLRLDTAKLNAALEADPEAVTKVFVGDPETDTKGAMAIVSAAIDRITDSKDGILQLRIGQFDRGITRLQTDAEAYQRRLDLYEASLRKRFTQLEDTISKIQFQGKGLASLSSSFPTASG